MIRYQHVQRYLMIKQFQILDAPLHRMQLEQVSRDNNCRLSNGILSNDIEESTLIDDIVTKPLAACQLTCSRTLD